MGNNEDGGFKLPMSVVVAIAIPFLAQAGAGVWWASGTSAELAEVTKDVQRLELVVDNLDEDIALQKLTTATVTQQLSTMAINLRDLKTDMKQLEDLLRQILNKDRAPL